MRRTDIAIVGGGLAGSTAAAMLGRAGISAILVDPHERYPIDFRCEKLDASQVELVQRTGLAGPVLRNGTLDLEVWIARFGRVIEKRPNHQYGILYHDLVNTVRAEVPPCIEFLKAKATELKTSAHEQHLTLSTGEDISARLIVMANGLNIGLRHMLGIGREIRSTCHSISIGFDIAPVGSPNFEFRALTYYARRPSDRMAYLTLFPVASGTRANLFVYRDMQDPWLRRLREAPEQTLCELMPGLRKMTGAFEVTSDVKIRPVDLYVSTGCLQPGVVLVGDAFATSCPAAGTGVSKVFTDVERLCNIHIPRWLASEGMGVDKIAAFYDDPVKRASDQFSYAKAWYLRALSTETGLAWQARRWARFGAQLGVGLVRPQLARWSMRWDPRQQRPAGSAAAGP